MDVFGSKCTPWGASQVGRGGKGFPGGTQFSSVVQSCRTLCYPRDCSTPGLPVHHQLPEFTQTRVVKKKKTTHLPMQVDIETWVWFLGWKDPLEEEMASGSSVLAWRIPWTEEPDGLQSMGLHRVAHNWSNLACTPWASLAAQTVKNLPAMQKTQDWSLSQEDSLEKGLSTHSSNLAWRIQWTEEPGGLQSTGAKNWTWLSN